MKLKPWQIVTELEAINARLKRVRFGQPDWFKHLILGIECLVTATVSGVKHVMKMNQ